MLPPDMEIFVCVEPISLHASFDTLVGLVQTRLKGEPKSGSLFVFFGKRKDKLKALYYDKTGYCIFYKRLETGTFSIPRLLSPADLSASLSDVDFEILLGGLGPQPQKISTTPRKKKEKIH